MRKKNVGRLIESNLVVTPLEQPGGELAFGACSPEPEPDEAERIIRGHVIGCGEETFPAHQSPEQDNEQPDKARD